MKKYFSNIRREDLSLFAIKALTVTAVLGTAMLFFEARYRIGIDTQKHPCVDAHVFLWDMYDRKLEKGNLYVFETAVRQIRPPFSMKKQFWMKRLAATGGDHVSIDEKGVLRINGEVTRTSLPLLRFNQGKSEDYAFNRILGEDELFFLGDTPDSYDSRYWGTVPRASIRGRGYSIF